MPNRPARLVSLNLNHSVSQNTLSLARIRPDITMYTNFQKIQWFGPFVDDLLPRAVWNNGGIRCLVVGPPSIILKVHIHYEK